MIEELRTFNAEKGVIFERHDVTGDVTIRFPSGEAIRISSNTWVSAVAAMTAHGDQMNYPAFKLMHTGVGCEV